MSLTNDDIVWYDSTLIILDIIDSYGEFSNVLSLVHKEESTITLLWLVVNLGSP